MLSSPFTVTLAVPLSFEAQCRKILDAEGMHAQDAGAARGSVDAAVLLVAIVPTVARLALVLEKLRRLRMPRTYVTLGRNGELDIYTDDRTPDGRIVVTHPDGRVVTLPDAEITPALLEAAIQNAGREDEQGK